ncbi:MAG: hypothetical protein RL154_131, partial [Pseudomonadota bacterium]
MNFLANLSVQKKLIMLITTTVVGLIGLFIISVNMTNKVFEAANYANTNSIPSIVLLGKLQDSYSGVRVRVYQHVLHTDNQEMHEIENELFQKRKSIDNILAEYQKSAISDDKDEIMLKNDVELWQKYIVFSDKILELSRANKSKEAFEYILANKQPNQDFKQAIEEHFKYNEDLAAIGASNALKLKNESVIFQTITILVVLLLIITLGIFIIKSIITSLDSFKSGLT